MSGRDEDGMDDAELRRLLRSAVEDVQPRSDLETVLGAGRRPHRPSPRAARTVAAVLAAAAAAAAIVGGTAAVQEFSSADSAPPVASEAPATPAPSPGDSASAQPTPGDTDLGSPDRDPFAPRSLASRNRWAVPVYRLLAVGPAGTMADPVTTALRGELVELSSDGADEDLLRAAYAADLPPGESDLGFPAFGAVDLEDLESAGDGDPSSPTVVSLRVGDLDPQARTVTDVEEAALQQLAWTARSVLQEPVRLRVQTADGAVREVAPDLDALDALQVATPLDGERFTPGEIVSVSGVVDGRVAGLTYDLSEGCGVDCNGEPRTFGGGDVTLRPLDGEADRRFFQVDVPVPDVVGPVVIGLTADQTALGRGFAGYTVTIDVVPSRR